MIPEHVDLFLGFPVTEELAAQIDSLPAKQRDLYIQPSGEYLTEVSIETGHFFGKPCGKLARREDLILLEENIYSLLEKILPNYPFRETPLTLFPLVSSCKSTAM